MARHIILNFIICFITFASFQSYGAFKEERSRYLSTTDYFKMMGQFFPLAQKVKFYDVDISKCLIVSKKNRGFLGAVIPAVGSTISSAPSINFLRFHMSCLKKLVEFEFSNYNVRVHYEMVGGTVSRKETPNYLTPKKELKHFFIEDVLTKAESTQGPESLYQRLNLVQWGSLSKDIQKKQIQFLVTKFIGTDQVLKDLNNELSMGVLTALLFNSLSDANSKTWPDVTKKIINLIMLREEVFRY